MAKSQQKWDDGVYLLGFEITFHKFNEESEENEENEENEDFQSDCSVWCPFGKSAKI